MQELQNWREVLSEVVGDQHERIRIAKELGIRPITLTRWISGQSDPRPQNLRRLFSLLTPEQKERLLSSSGGAFGDLEGVGELENVPKDIPTPFYLRVFSMRAITTESQRFWSISKLILQQALEQLDPDRLGMAIVVVRCMPPAEDQKIRSLRESMGVGTPPWKGDLEHKAMFLGAESLAGYAASSSRPSIIQNVYEDRGMLPAQKVEYEVSSATYPITFANRIAGCLLVSSTRKNNFLQQTRLNLIENYANLLALAFEPEEFYETNQLELRIMPAQSVQKVHFADFRKRVSDTIWKANREGQPVSSLQAEEQVWRELEEELIKVANKERS